MRILLAEDEIVSRTMLEQLLTVWGHEVIVACDGLAAWEILQRNDSPRLAILDWLMPGLDGVEICRKVRRESEAPFIYLVLLTGKTRPQDIILGMESGADDYVRKPFDEQELRVRLRAGERIVELHQVLLDQATHDPLTGIWNRKVIVDILQRELARAMREESSVAIAMADIDHFKRINDSRGHLGGDAAIREVSKLLVASLRPSDSVGRYGGEEFLIVLPRSDLSGAMAMAERMRRVIAEADIATPTGRLPITLSLGVAISEEPRLDVNGLIRVADEALYRAKRAGRNRVEVAVRSGNPRLSNLADTQVVVGR